jgi:hypothetical protein
MAPSVLPAVAAVDPKPGVLFWLELSADTDRAPGVQQVIPLLPFGYATESVDHVSLHRLDRHTDCQW